MGKENPKEYSQEEQDGMSEQRILSDARLIEGGARTKDGTLRPTEMQVGVIKDAEKGKGEKGQKIEKRGKYLVAVRNGKEYYVSPNGGRIINTPWDKIGVVGDALVGKFGNIVYVIDSESGEMSEVYFRDIFERDGLLIGAKDGFEMVIDPSTARSLSRPYHRIENRGDHIVGILGSDESLIKLEKPKREGGEK